MRTIEMVAGTVWSAWSKRAFNSISRRRPMRSCVQAQLAGYGLSALLILVGAMACGSSPGPALILDAAAGCGAASQSCCSGAVCGQGLFCLDGICQPSQDAMSPCGNAGQPCCTGTCGSGLSCDATQTCVAPVANGCGAYMQGCCEGMTCSQGYSCRDGICQGAAPSCGVTALVCCSGDLCVDGSVCEAGVCSRSDAGTASGSDGGVGDAGQTNADSGQNGGDSGQSGGDSGQGGPGNGGCGGRGQICCSSQIGMTACHTSLFCNGGRCEDAVANDAGTAPSCGQMGAPCCNGTQPCAPNLSCTGGICGSNADPGGGACGAEGMPCCNTSSGPTCTGNELACTGGICRAS